MNQRLIASVILLALAGCSGEQQPPATATSPPAVAAEVADNNGPPPPPDPVMQSAPDAELEAAIRATDPNYRADAAGDVKAKYAAARADLNGDGKDEVFVYLMGPYFCGTGGCTLLVFSQGMDGYSLLAKIPTSEALVIHADTKNAGYADFWRMQSGGGMPAEFVQHRFEDGKYVEASRAKADLMPNGAIVMDETTALAHSLVLEPWK
jgi:hypothetical protein